MWSELEGCILNTLNNGLQGITGKQGARANLSSDANNRIGRGIGCGFEMIYGDVCVHSGRVSVTDHGQTSDVCCCGCCMTSTQCLAECPGMLVAVRCGS